MSLPHDLDVVPRNRLLTALPADSLARLRPMLAPVELRLGGILHAAGDRLDRVYFPESGWVSLLKRLDGGEAAEVGLVGSEGVIGLPLLLGVDNAPLEAMVQGPGWASSLTADAFHRVVGADAALRAALLQHVHAQMDQVTYTAACNGRHVVEQRLARWLLMSHDRADGDTFAMTHEFMSMMLCVRRPSVSLAAAALQQAGLIRYARGSIAVIDRPGLENASCGCYGLARKRRPHVTAMD